MGISDVDRPDRGPCCYRIELEGELGTGLEGWIDVESIRMEGGVTVLELSTADQAQLHGLLRRLHDLHLGLVGLKRIEYPCRGGNHEQG
jgi:hypothetical protein